jgi:hypothetical protein
VSGGTEELDDHPSGVGYAWVVAAFGCAWLAPALAYLTTSPIPALRWLAWLSFASLLVSVIAFVVLRRGGAKVGAVYAVTLILCASFMLVWGRPLASGTSESRPSPDGSLVTVAVFDAGWVKPGEATSRVYVGQAGSPAARQVTIRCEEDDSGQPRLHSRWSSSGDLIVNWNGDYDEVVPRSEVQHALETGADASSNANSC